jgi:hypothetical protein
MADPKKPYNPAKAMFGLDDAPVDTGHQPGRPAPKTAEATTSPSQTGQGALGYTSPGVSFGPQAPQSPRGSQASGPTPQASDPSASYHAAQPENASPPMAGSPQYIYVQTPPASTPSPRSSGLRWLVIILLILSGVNLYLVLMARHQLAKTIATQSDQINLLTRRADSTDDRYAQLSARFQVTAERLGLTQKELARARQLAASIEKQQQESVQQLNAAIAQKASAQQVNQLQSEANAKFGSLSGSLAGTQKDLEATKEALTGAKGELSGAIARTHAELVELAHRTDRDYFEFHLASKGARQKIGSLQVQLLKTNTKHNLFTVNLYFDDKVSQRRNEAIDEPVYFYMQGAPSALELVVNKLGKNSISGYVSAPKGFIHNAPNVLEARPTA